MRRIALFAAPIALAFAAAPVLAHGHHHHGISEADAERLAAVLASDHRADDAPRDGFRNPAETLAFFGVESDMTVLEMAPGGGWYTRVLAPYLADDGAFAGANYHPMTFNPDGSDSLANWPQTFAASFAETYPETTLAATFTYQTDQAEELGEFADAVLFFRAVHGLVRTGRAEEVLGEVYTVLNPGGVVGVVQHRAKADAPDDYADGSNGYLRQADVIAMFENAGFEFEEASEVNANPTDPANHDGGVWNLLPVGRGGEDLHYIGESDRMTLRFRKPE